jgi:putative transposase
VIERIDKAYKRFFDWCKKRTDRRVSPPKFRKRIKYKSFTLKQAGWKLLSDDRIQVGRCSYKFHNSRKIDGDIKTVTLSRDAVGDWWVVFSVKQDDQSKTRHMTGKTAGLDFGMTTFITLSTGETIAAPQPLLRLLKTLKSASRKVSRKQKGSNSRKRALKNLARLHRRIANQRLDWMHKTAHSLAQAFDVICVEDLALEGMKRLWGRKVSDIAWHQFSLILSWHCLKAGSKLVKVDRFYPSSKLCSVCGYLHAELELRDRQWLCPQCGTAHNRDGNAAVNIHSEGLRLFAEKYEGGYVLREKAA